MSEILKEITIMKGGCERVKASTLEVMLGDMKIGDKKREKGPTFLWLERGGDAWKHMTEMIGDGKAENAAEVRPVTLVNTRIIESRRRMGKRERREMGGWLDLAKFMGAEKDGHTVEENDTVGNGGDVGPFVLESENYKKNERGEIPSMAELRPKGLSIFAPKE